MSQWPLAATLVLIFDCLHSDFCGRHEGRLEEVSLGLFVRLMLARLGLSMCMIGKRRIIGHIVRYVWHFNSSISII